MDASNISLSEGEAISQEIPTSSKTVAYYSFRAAPLFGVWFIGLVAFLIFTYKTNLGNPSILLFQALARSTSSRRWPQISYTMRP